MQAVSTVSTSSTIAPATTCWSSSSFFVELTDDLVSNERGKSRLAVTVADRAAGPGAGIERAGCFDSRLIQRLVAQLSGELQVTDARRGRR